MATVGAVWINVLPSMQGFASNLQKQATSAAKVAALGAGTQMGASMGDATVGALTKKMTANSRRMQNTFAGSTNVMTRALSNFRAGFADVDAAASVFTGRMGALGGVAARGLRPGLDGLGRFRDGFRSAEVAASAFSGRMGTMGGETFRAFRPGWEGLTRLGEGFRNSQVAASAFSGRMGAVGGHLRTVFDGGAKSVGAVGTAFGRVRDGAATAFGTVTSVGGKALSGVRSGLTSITQSARQADSGVGGLGSSLGRMGAIGGAALGAIGIGGFVRGVYQTSVAVNEARASLTGMYGDAGQAQEMVAAINDEFARSSVGVGTLNELAANLAYLGLEGEGALDVIRNIDTAAGALPGDASAAVESVTNALLTAQVQGNAFTGELNQISRIGFPVFDALAEHIGVTSGEIKDMASQGEISFEDLMAVMNDPGLSHFWDMTEASAQEVSQTFSQTLSGIGSMVRVRFGEMAEAGLERLTPGLERIGDAVESGLDKLPGVLGRVRDVLVDSGIVDAFWRLVEGVKDFAAEATPALRPFGEVVGFAFGAVLRAMGPVGELFSKLAGWMRDNAGAVRLVGAALGGLVVGIVAVRTVTMAWATAQAILNAAMAANPIGLIVVAVAALVAGLVYAYRNFEGFRNVVDAVWKAVKTAALWIWDRGLKPAFEGIKTGLSWVGSALASVGKWFVNLGETVMGLWTDYIQPVFEWIWGLIKIVVTAIIVAAIGPLVLAFKLVSAVVMWLWENAIKPVFQWIGDLAVWLWENALKPAWDGIVAGVKWLGGWFKRLWTSYVQPVLDWVGEGFQWLWGHIKNVFNWIVAHIQRWWTLTKFRFELVIAFIRGAFANAFNWFKDRVIRPVWNWISGHINRIWENGIKPAFEKVMEGVDWLKDAFDSGKEFISEAWEGIRDSAKKPVNFLIDTVFNNGIRSIWNRVAGIVGADEIDKVPKFASGGVLPGYTPGRDVHMFVSPTGGALALSGGEAIMRPEVTRAMGTAGVDRLNAAARSGGVSGVREVLGYSRGGVLGRPARFARGGWLSINDINPPTEGILSAAAKFIKDIAVDVFTGDLGGAVDKFFKPAKAATKQFGTKGFPGTPYQMVDKFNTSVKEKIESFLDFFTGDGEGGFAAVGKGKAGDVVRLARASVGKYPESNGNNTNAITNWYGMNGAPWCAMYISWLFNKARASGSLGRAARTAWTGDYYRSGMRRVGVGARQPGDVVVYGTSHVNMYDGNGYTIGGNESNNVRRSRGYVGRGAAFRPMWKAASGGILDRQRMRRIALQDPHDRETPIGRSMRGLYDRGGYVQPGMTLVSNRTGRPEPVLTDAQWRDMHRIAASVGAGESGLMRDAHIHLHDSQATVREAFREVDTELRKRRRGGVHAGRVGR